MRRDFVFSFRSNLLSGIYFVIRYPFFQVDEWFTKGLINLSFIEGMQKYMRFNEYLNETTIYTNFHINNVTKNLDYTEILGLDNTTFIVPDDIGNHTVYFICDKKTGYMGHPEEFRVIKSERVLNSKIFRIANE